MPSRTTSQRFIQPLINRDVRRITRMKRRWFRRARRSKHPKDWLRSKALKKEAQKTCRVTHDNYSNNMLTNENKNPKRFWKFIKPHKKDSTGVYPLKKEGLTFSDSLNKANIMGDQFCSIFTQEDMSELPGRTKPNTLLASHKGHIKGVLKLLKASSPTKRLDLITSLEDC